MKYSPVPNSHWPISCQYQSEADDKYIYLLLLVRKGLDESKSSYSPSKILPQLFPEYLEAFWYFNCHPFYLLLYAYCSFSAVIGQIMVTWPPYKIDIGVHNSLDSLSILFEWAVGI